LNFKFVQELSDFLPSKKKSLGAFILSGTYQKFQRYNLSRSSSDFFPFFELFPGNTDKQILTVTCSTKPSPLLFKGIANILRINTTQIMSQKHVRKHVVRTHFFISSTKDREDEKKKKQEIFPIQMYVWTISCHLFIVINLIPNASR
jgi:hypothetical protein